MCSLPHNRRDVFSYKAEHIDEVFIAIAKQLEHRNGHSHRRLTTASSFSLDAVGDLFRNALFRSGFAGIFHRIERRKLDILELAINSLDLADVDVLDDVACLRID